MLHNPSTRPLERDEMAGGYEVGGMIHLDFDRNGVLLGIEVLAASKLLPASLLEGAGSDD